MRTRWFDRTRGWVTLGMGVALATATSSLVAQTRTPADSAPPDSSRIYPLSPVVISATRTEKAVFDVPKPVSVLDTADIRQKAPNTVADLFRDLPGVDVAGVGVTQVRPTIRGQRGQRILLLEDGLRLNTSRRQQDFGEVVALADVSALARVEVVRGPASVLYGTDAIGGVVNLISSTPRLPGLHGSLGYRYSTQDGQHHATGSLSGRVGALTFLARGTVRDADDYSAPAGSYGNITLAENTRVNDTGARDANVQLFAGYQLAARQEVFARYERYRADTSGFGFVEPEAYDPGGARVRILYPDQNFDKVSAGYRGFALGLPVADRVEVTGYFQDNSRWLANDVFVSFGPPGAGVSSLSYNYTDLETFGGRLEASKLAFGRVMFTYGADLFRDRSRNTDSSVTTVTGFGPPQTEVNNVPSVPNAAYQSAGAFLQGDVEIVPGASLILGGRYQDVRAATRATPGRDEPLVDESDQTVVGAANLIVQPVERLSLVATVGRAFRSPNLVERFFSGFLAEAGTYQVRNPDLGPETSLNVDLGARYRDRYTSLEAFVFRNEIRNGIRTAATGDSVNGLPSYWNVNVDRLRYTGVEVSGSAATTLGLFAAANFTKLVQRDVVGEDTPIGDGYGTKIAGELGYRHPGDRFWLAYSVRYNGDRRDIELDVDGPIGEFLPAFTSHSVRAGATVIRRGAFTQRVNVAATNLTDALYAEFANASFFRPEARRGVTLGWEMTF